MHVVKGRDLLEEVSKHRIFKELELLSLFKHNNIVRYNNSWYTSLSNEEKAEELEYTERYKGHVERRRARKAGKAKTREGVRIGSHATEVIEERREGDEESD